MALVAHPRFGRSQGSDLTDSDGCPTVCHDQDAPTRDPHHRSFMEAPQRAALPTNDELRRTINDRETMLADPTLTDVIRVRAERTLSSTVAILDLSEGDPAREAAARTV